MTWGWRPGGPAYPVLLLLGALDAAGYSVIAPVLPVVSAHEHLGPAGAGLLASAFPAAMLAALPIAGRQIRRGRLRATLLASLALSVVGSLVFAAQLNLTAFFVARAAMGFGSGGLWMGVTLAALAYWPGQEYQCMARIYGAYSIGAVVGPALGSLGGIGWPFLLYAVLLGVVGLAALALPPTPVGLFVLDRTALHTRGFWVAAVAIMLAISATGLIDGVLPLHFARRLSQPQIGGVYVVVAILIAIGSVVAGRYRPWPVVVLSAVGVIAGVVLAGATVDVPTWLVGLAVIGIGTGLCQTGATGLLLGIVPTHRITSAMAVWSQVGMTGYLAGPALGGLVAEHLGFAWLGAIPAAAFVALLALRHTPGAGR